MKNQTFLLICIVLLCLGEVIAEANARRGHLMILTLKSFSRNLPKNTKIKKIGTIIRQLLNAGLKKLGDLMRTAMVLFGLALAR